MLLRNFNANTKGTDWVNLNSENQGVKAKVMQQLFILEQQKEKMNHHVLKYLSSFKIMSMWCVFLLEDPASLKDTFTFCFTVF